MNYKTVYLEEKKVAGLKIRTSNSDSNMAGDIGKLWQDFYAKGIYQGINQKVNDKTIGLYTNYESDVSGKYDMMVCCEVESSVDLPEGLDTHIIPAGKYAEFIVTGDVHTAMAEFWTKFWAMDLNRKYSSDFEEYQNTGDMSNAVIKVYISLK